MAKSIKVVPKNDGPKLDYSVSGTKISFRDGEMTLDLARYQQEEPVDIDISLTLRGILVNGIGHRYAAQISLPGKEFEMVPSGAEDEHGEPVLMKQYKDLNMGDVTLTLWSLGVSANV